MKFSESGDPRERDVCEAYLALPHRLEDPWAWTLVEDSGLLEWSPSEIRLLGKQDHSFLEVSSLSLVRQPFPALTVLISNVMLVGMVLFGFFQTLTPTDPVTWGVLACLNVLLIGSTLSTHWIRVDFRGSAGAESIYLLPKDRASMHKFFHASRELHELLNHDVLEERRP